MLDAEIAALEARLTPIFWERVAPVWGVHRGPTAGLSPLAERHDRIARLEAAVERARAGPHAEPDLPELPPAPAGVLASINQAFAHLPAELAQAVRAAVHEHAPEAELTYRALRTWGVRLRADGAPIDLRLVLEPSRSRQSNLVLYGDTTVAPAARLRLKPEGILQDLLEVVGLSPEIELGDPAFDPVFEITGDEETARAFLVPEVKRAILMVSEEDGVDVRVVGGRVRFWSGSASRRATARVIEILARWHALGSPHPLLA